MMEFIRAFLAASGEAVVRGILGRVPQPIITGGRLAAGVQSAVETVVLRKGYPIPRMGSPEFGDFILRIARTMDISGRMNRNRGRRTTPIEPGPYPGLEPSQNRYEYTLVLEYRNPNGEIRDVIVTQQSERPMTWSNLAETVSVSVGDSITPTSPPPPQSGGEWLINNVRVISAYKV